MKITAVETLELEAPLEKPWKIATFTLKSLTATLVRIQTDDGVSGIGECIARLGPGVTAAIINEILKPVLLGRDPNDIEAIWEDMYSTMRARGHSRGFLLEAISGVDIALWDLLGKAANKPTWQLLAGHGRRSLPAYASSILLDTPDVMAQEAINLVQNGYNAIKLKVGQSVRADIPRIEAVRAAVGNDIELMLDANAGYDATSAIQVGRAAEKLGIYWLEEPVLADDLGGYARVRSAVKDIRIAAGEGEFTSSGFRPFFEQGLLDIAQPDIARAGGFTGCRRVAAYANAYNIAVAPHTGASGPICIAASLHLGAAIPNFLIFENMYIYNPLLEIFSEPIAQPVKSQIAVPTKPGLGIALDNEQLKRFSRNGGWR
ncbi:MAG TPA: mandelate racemase/muconate lactonizing enzyme family protein [Eoetvoesiella sp.]